MLGLQIVEAKTLINPGMYFTNQIVCAQVNLFIFQATPEPSNNKIVHPAPFAVHADCDGRRFQNRCERLTGELYALVGNAVKLWLDEQVVFAGLEQAVDSMGKSRPDSPSARALRSILPSGTLLPISHRKLTHQRITSTSRFSRQRQKNYRSAA